MANKDDHLTYYREFFENFAQTVNPNDQLPVKLGSYKLINKEVIGGVVDWTTQYLTQKKCPENLIAPLIQIVIDETRKSCKKQPLACGFNPSDNAYEPLKLMQTVMAKTNEICLRYLDNSMLCSLPPPTIPHCKISVCAAKNKRRRMEDRHAVIHDLNTMFNIQEATPSSYYAIFDGHAGHDAAAYSAAHLHQFLAESKHFVPNAEQALLDAFYKTDALFIDKCQVENFSSGTTAVCALLRPKEKTLYIAWVGDSQALLVNQGRILQCVDPHKPGRHDERERIEKSGGYVCYWGTWRVNGQLAVSRAIGDSEYKPYVTAVPDIRKVPLDGGEDFLILACDGLWDYLSEEDAARSVYNMVCENSEKLESISEHLVFLAKQRGSADNISVIVVFLREPSKIAADAHWANRNTMDTSLDNANNPFANSNGTESTIHQKADGLLLNLSDNFKNSLAQEVSPSADFYPKNEKANGKRLASEFDEDDDLGPETDVDAVDDVPAIAAATAVADGIANNNPAGTYNPFLEKEDVEKATLELDLDLQKQQGREFDDDRSPREETPTPPADAVHDGALEDNLGDSGEESEDEWNYIKGEEASKENSSQPEQPDDEVADISEDSDNMSQLNPNAAEFVPVSPTRSIPSPACRALLNDEVIAQSPKRPVEIDISVPNALDFENEVKSRPSDFNVFSNGHNNENDQKTSDLMEELLNGKNIDEIPEFQPGSTPSKTEEFHFGPNAAPFTPKMLDQSEALSTKAVLGDETTLEFDSTLDASRDLTDFLGGKAKETDPMCMSFYQDDLDLNKVQKLPDDDEDELVVNNEQQIPQNDTISDLPEHNPSEVFDNDKVITTDLDKEVDDEKELASPDSTPEDNGTSNAASSPQPPKEIDILGDSFQEINNDPLVFDEVEEERESPLVTYALDAHGLTSRRSMSPSQDEHIEHFDKVIEDSPLLECDLDVDTFMHELEEDSKNRTPREYHEICPLKTKEDHHPTYSFSSESDDSYYFKPQEPKVEAVVQTDHKEYEFMDDTAMFRLSPLPGEPGFQPEIISEPVKEAEATNLVPESTTLESEPVKLESEPAVKLCPAQLESEAIENVSVADFESEPEAIVCAVKLESEPVEDVAQSPTPSPAVISPEPERIVSPELVCEVQSSKSPVPELSVESPVDEVTSSVKDATSAVASPVRELNFVQENSNEVEDIVRQSSPIRDGLSSPIMCPIIATPKSQIGTESGASIDSFLDRSQISSIASPFSQSESVAPSESASGNKTDTVIEPVEQPVLLSPILVEEPKTPAKEEKTTKAKVTPSTKRVGAAPAKTTQKSTSSPLAKASRPLLSKTSAAPLAKPKPLEKKPLTNGDVKKPLSAASARLSAAKSPTKPAAVRPATAPTKPTLAAAKPKPAAPTRTTTASSSITKSPANTSASTKSPAARTSLGLSTSRTATTRPTSLKASAVGVKQSPTTTKTSTLTTTKPLISPLRAAKPATAPLKPRVPLTKTVTKSVETEKQNKDSANKLTASKSLPGARPATKTSTLTASTVKKIEASTSVRKVDTKTATRTSLTKSSTTSTTTARAPAKKPTQVTRTVAKTTKIEKPVQNGVSVITEQLIVNEGELAKDNSPVDNKLVAEAAD